MPATTYAHIELREGVPYVEGTQTKVLEVALDHIAYSWNALEMHEQHPDLTLGQIHSALAYYHDHRASIDHEIEAGLREVEQLRLEHDQSDLAAKVRSRSRQR